MKNLYRKGSRAKMHPSLPINPIILSSHLSFLPAAILTLTVALSPEDREVLAYLISHSNSCSSISSSNHRRKTKNHPPLFNCDCFWCYMSYWVRWDSSPNRHLIHEIIDAFEDWLLMMQRQGRSTNYKNRKRKGNNRSAGEELKQSQSIRLEEELGESSSDTVKVEGEKNSSSGGCEEEGLEKGWSVSVKRVVSFIGERIWGVWANEGIS